MKRKAGYMILTATVALCTGASLPFLLGNSVLNPEQQSVKSEVPTASPLLPYPPRLPLPDRKWTCCATTTGNVWTVN